MRLLLGSRLFGLEPALWQARGQGGRRGIFASRLARIAARAGLSACGSPAVDFAAPIQSIIPIREALTLAPGMIPKSGNRFSGKIMPN
jgi:hypothetical protein